MNIQVLLKTLIGIPLWLYTSLSLYIMLGIILIIFTEPITRRLEHAIPVFFRVGDKIMARVLRVKPEEFRSPEDDILYNANPRWGLKAIGLFMVVIAVAFFVVTVWTRYNLLNK